MWLHKQTKVLFGNKEWNGENENESFIPTS